MTKIKSLQDLRDWVQEDGFYRNADITLNNQFTTGYEEKIWVYDYELQEGQHINIPGEITFYEKAKENMEMKMEAIQKRMAKLGDNDD